MPSWPATSPLILVAGAACLAGVGVVVLKVIQTKHLRELLAQERLGRTKAERALRQRKQEQLQSTGHEFDPIGYVDSCFPGRCGAPRQGILAPATRARLTLSSHISPFAIEGLQEYSHLWVIFVFDENTNACSEKGKSAQSRTFPAKVAPPQLHGKRVGLFSTRTPHRPNPIGLTLVKVISVDTQKRTILVGGVDLVHDTPILDLKPYIPGYDCLNQASCPSWVREGGSPELNVTVEPAALEQLSQIKLPKASLFVCWEDLLQALKEVLRLDIRSTYQGRGQAASDAAVPGKSEAKQTDYEFHFDVLRVKFTNLDSGVTVTSLALDNVKTQRYKTGKGRTTEEKRPRQGEEEEETNKESPREGESRLEAEEEPKREQEGENKRESREARRREKREKTRREMREAGQ